VVSAAAVLAHCCGAFAFSISSVPSFVPSGRLYAFSCSLGRTAETADFTSKLQSVQTSLNR
jgi:hypothetical protein